MAKLEREVNGHSIMFSRFLLMGSGHRQEDRVKSAVVSKDGHIPALAGLRKDHKNVVEGQEVRGPPLRPICKASTSINGALAHTISIALVPLSMELDREVGTECISTEEMLASIHAVNARDGIRELVK